jgi:hypothetical protein
VYLLFIPDKKHKIMAPKSEQVKILKIRVTNQDALGRKDRLEKLESSSEKFDDGALKGLTAQVLFDSNSNKCMRP